MSKKKIAVVGVFALLLVVVVVIGVVVGVRKGSEKKPKDDSNETSMSSMAITAVCQPTDYKESCVSNLESLARNTSDPKELIQVGFQAAVNALKEAMNKSSTLKEFDNDSRTSQALENCEELMGSAIDDLQSSFDNLSKLDVSKLGDYVDELRIWLSGAVTFEESCLDEFEDITSNDAGEKMKNILQASRELSSNGLAMVTGISSVFNSLNVNRRLLRSNRYYSDLNGSFSDENGYPSWVSSGSRKLLTETSSTIKANAVVAKDGSGQFKTITDALNTVPKNNNETFVIYIKAGVYQETVMITKHMTNVMFIGDGPMKTKITGNLNYVDGVQTMRTATVSALGNNFVAKDMGFENSAGAIKQQAVALRVQSHRSVFYNCRMDGYQDTLYVHAHSQFYRDCTITGTIDFIFGNAAAVFQNCKMVIRKPLSNQSCIVTAQGRTDLRAPTGIVLQNCTVTGDADYWPVKNVNKAYLGRPWKEYSRTIIMQSQIDDIIQPQGWLPLDGGFALDTCWYTEYGNRGPGSAQAGRVTWKGIKNMNAAQVNDFTVAQFIKDGWIKLTGVPYASGMMKI